MNKNLYFLSGIPRSGSTVLAAILNQNPKVHVSSTSGLVHALNAMATIWGTNPLLDANDPDRKKLAQTMRGLIDAFYQDINRPNIIDKSRGWPIPVIMNSMSQVLDRPLKIIATVRSIPECAASFIRVVKPKDLDDFIQTGGLMEHLQAAYISLQEGYIFSPQSFLFVEYENLIADPVTQLERIHDFLEFPKFDYNFREIDGSGVKEDDEMIHGHKGMHDIKPVLEKQHNDDPQNLLEHHYPQYCQPEFWLDRPKTLPKIHDLDLQLTASTIGDFAEGWRLAQKIELEEPRNDRAAYNRGWYYLRQGQIQKGYELLDRGRRAGVFGNYGNHMSNLRSPMWDGKTSGTVLLILEAGLGDQIHQIRYAKNIADRGCKVVVACIASLVELFSEVDGVSAVVQYEHALGVYHDFCVYGASAIRPLGFELADISGDPYIKKPFAIKHSKKRIGLRWQGQSKFEKEHMKKFPYDLMFDAVQNIDAEFISLQRDEGSDACPSWVKQVPLDTWKDTQNAIASCDLVISSCTSVSHLSAAMGVETWVIIPIMSYFLYAIPGERTPYYNSMRLFRQEIFLDWTHPFKYVRQQLENLYK